MQRVSNSNWQDRANQGLLALALVYVALSGFNSTQQGQGSEIYPPVAVPPLPAPVTPPEPSAPNTPAPSLPTPEAVPPITTPSTPNTAPEQTPDRITPPIAEAPNKPEGGNTNAKVNRVLEAALSWVGREFNPGVPAQCAFFVRAAFKQGGYPLPISRQSIDPRNSQSAGMAHSLCGLDVGERVNSLSDMKPGCIAAFERTYGSWGPGYITHVGIYAGGWKSSSGRSIPKGYMIDRNTKGGPVRIKDIKDYGNKFIAGFCPHILFK